MSSEDMILLESAKIASSMEVRSSMALGITIKVIRNREIIEVIPDKSVKVLRKISRPTIDISALKKGMVLERKPARELPFGILNDEKLLRDEKE